jgi:gliding motility-associated-like protein
LITFNDITKTYGDPNFDLTASSSSTGAFTFSISDTDIASVTGSTVSIVSSGITIATVSQAADNNYNSATATMTLTVNKADPIIIFENFSVDLVDSQFIIPFESNSNGDLTFNLLNEELGIINLNSLLPQEIGQTTMYLFQSETSNFNSGNAIATLSILEGIDSDQDGITDTYDLDDDNDGILDVKEKSDDFDGDGVINSLDIDSDGDGCFDVIEAGFSDPDFDGIVGTSPVVVNNFGIVQNSNAYSDPLDLNQNLNYDFLEFAKDFKLYNLNLPDQIEFNLNETLLIDIGVENSNQLNYQWQISSDDGKSFSNLNQTNHILEIKPNLEDDKNQYRIVIDQIGFECSDIFISNSTKINYSQVFIPSGFSPNGDGVNDFWQIIGIDKYPNNKVSVFNRLGIKIYESTNYNNDWNGFYNGNLISDGTYYYIINYGTGNIKKGFIYVNTN